MDREFAPPPDKFSLKAYVVKYSRQFWIQAAGGIIYNTFVVAGPIYLGTTIDAANAVFSGEAPISLFYINLAAFLGFTLLFQLARYYKRYYIRELSNLIRCDMRAGLLKTLLRAPMWDLSQEKVGDMMSRMIGDVEQVSEAVRKTITEIWDTVLLMLSYFVACMVYSPRITLLASIPIPVAVVIAELLRRPMYTLSQKARKSASKVNVHLQHNISGVSLLRLFGLEAVNRKKFSALLNEQLKWNVASAALQNGMLPLYTLVASLGIIIVVGKGGGLVVGGTWSIGSFMAYLTMFTAMSTRTRSVARVMNNWHGAKASWDRITEKMRSGDAAKSTDPPQEAAKEAAKSTALETATEAAKETATEAAKSTTLETATDSAMDSACRPSAPFLSVRNLSFSYPFSDARCLAGISFDAAKGEMIGVTGPVGSGKSALASVLTGLYPFEGEACIDGVPLDVVKKRASGRIAYMDAEQFVFSEDVSFNVTLDRECGDLEGSVRLAMMDEDIAGFESRMSTRLMERGVRVSGGQRQRIALARAWYGQSDLLLLDDPFSAVDINMESQIMDNIRAASDGRTVLLFSHRLLAFPQLDRVIMLENGRITQIGTHDELLRQDGLYKDIYMAQAFLGEGS